MTGERLGRAGTLRLAPRGGLPWTAGVRPKSGRARGFLTEYEASEPRWATGTLVLIAARPDAPLDGDPAAASVGRDRALRDLLGAELARLSGTLCRIEAPEGLTALAVGDVQRRSTFRILGGRCSLGARRHGAAGRPGAGPVARWHEAAAAARGCGGPSRWNGSSTSRSTCRG
jgi:hypothetical protein